ncbi:DNA polymerase III subunit gamma/tau [Candidatus Kaiserbacteria bacterium]|nr:DNA polymerase III subunit gamma/tau [Candidatus Kaiserbacteria bacterium]
MSESQVLYRKYRPEKFSDVRNQEHIVSVLEGAIKKEAIPHAILFSGGRGTGKTTLARIFAKEIGTSSVDLYEIDAASNRGIDDIRELKEAVYTVPYESKYKVYIIDEVHMLTKEAFNALLKTLEEPPAHVVFILATTEEEKLLDTIKSRCQCFTFKLPSVSVLSETVTDIAKTEGFKLKPAAAELIAVSADGSFRDALGVLQKVMLASGDTIGDADEVAKIIGAPKQAILCDLLNALNDKDTQAALTAITSVVSDQVDMKLFSRTFLSVTRAVMLVRNQPSEADTILTSFNDDTSEVIKKVANTAGSPVNSHSLVRLLDAAQQTKHSPLPQLPIELAIIDITT